MKVPLLNFVGSPGVPLLHFEGGPVVPLLNFRGVPGPTFKRWGGSHVPGPGSRSHFYTMPVFDSLILSKNSLFNFIICSRYPREYIPFNKTW